MGLAPPREGGDFRATCWPIKAVSWLTNRSREEAMIKVSVFYPHTANASFDMTYYVTKHMPMVRDKLGSVCKGIAVDQGVAGGAPGSTPSYVAIGHILCESADAF